MITKFSWPQTITVVNTAIITTSPAMWLYTVVSTTPLLGATVAGNVMMMSQYLTLIQQ